VEHWELLGPAALALVVPLVKLEEEMDEWKRPKNEAKKRRQTFRKETETDSELKKTRMGILVILD
jgi:hypothetical protein